jgi:hypothetical protein
MGFKFSNHLERELDTRLSNWAHWVYSIISGEVGFPNKSTIADFDMGGAYHLIRLSKPPFPLNNSTAQEMNNWINLMGQYRPEYKQVLIEVYINKKSSKKTSEYIGVPKRTFYDHLRGAKNWLGGCISLKAEQDGELIRLNMKAANSVFCEPKQKTLV